MTTASYIQKIDEGRTGGPLLFVFHGTGADENQLFGIARQLMPDATIVSPRGDVSEHGAPRFFRRTGEGIYDMEDLAARTAKMAGYVQAHKEARKPSAVLGMGYSNGANILASVVFSEPDLFDGAVLMHPLIPFQPEVKGTLENLSVLITAGRGDPICPEPMTESLGEALKSHHASVDTAWHDGGHEARPEEFEAARQLLSRWVSKGRSLMEPGDDGIELEDGPAKGRYLLRGGGGAEAELTFTKIGQSQIIIDHTSVPDAFRGQGAGVRLIERAVNDARSAGKTIIPLCPFAAAQFRRHPEWADVLKK